MSNAAGGNRKITACLWFNGEAEEAANVYVELFNNSPHAADMQKSAIGPKAYYNKDITEHGANFKAGTAVTVHFNLGELHIMGLNGGPMFKFTPAVSLMVECADQEEIDYFWKGFGEGITEREMDCGWIKDKYGMSWQVVPKYIRELAEQSDKEKYNNLNAWMMQNIPKKFDVKALMEAAEGRA